jgi:flavin reductase (DIM6/NTAB) family NADH-FMN oxidoreductase RutF
MRPEQSSAPEPAIDPRVFRNVIGVFATGVTVVAVGNGSEYHAMTANAITSVSLEPLLVLVCVGRQTGMVEHLNSEQGFSISILRRSQEALSNYFGGIWKSEVPPNFEFVPWQGGPLLKDCAAALGCETFEVFEGGDHLIFIGKVIALHQGDDPVEPLLFYRGRYRELASLTETDDQEIYDTALWAFPW